MPKAIFSRGPPLQPHMTQSFPPPDYNDFDKVNKKFNNMERMSRELKESKKRMMKTISEQFAQSARSNKERWTFPSQSEVNSRERSSSSFGPSDVRKVNFIISIWSDKKVDIHVGDQNVNQSPPRYCSPPSSKL